jgi:hypothetical protein
MRPVAAGLGMLFVAQLAEGQPAGKFPPDSLVNTRVFPRSTPVSQVTGMMRNFAFELGVPLTPIPRSVPIERCASGTTAVMPMTSARARSTSPPSAPRARAR